MNDSGEIKVFNTAKKEAEEITFPIIQSHRNYIIQARTGEIPGTPIGKINKNNRQINRVKALHLIISSQKDMIQVARPIARYKSYRDWNKKKDEYKKDNKFEDEENDYNSLINIRKMLNYFDSIIMKADKSKNEDEDFLSRIQNGDEVYLELTSNFHEMFGELEDTYEDIYMILIRHKLASAGIEEDEEKTYKELEEEAIKRVVNA